jgi:hypothetical protein
MQSGDLELMLHRKETGRTTCSLRLGAHAAQVGDKEDYMQ